MLRVGFLSPRSPRARPTNHGHSIGIVGWVGHALAAADRHRENEKDASMKVASTKVAMCDTSAKFVTEYWPG